MFRRSSRNRVGKNSISKIQPPLPIDPLAHAMRPVIESLEKRQMLTAVPAGTPDSTFGTLGSASTDFNNAHLNDDASAILVQTVSGVTKYVVVGTNVNTGAIEIARYNRDGSLDSSFGSGGTVTTSLSGSAEGNAAAFAANGDLLIAGAVQGTTTGQDFAVVRYDANGALETSWGTGGSVAVDFNGKADVANGIAVQPGGQIVVSGYATVGSRRELAVALISDSGTVGTKTVVPIGSSGNSQANGVAVQSDGSIVIVGQNTTVGGSESAVLVRMTPAGALDTTFNGSGIVQDSFGGNGVGNAVAIQSLGGGNNQYYITGGAQGEFLLARYTSSGVLDTSFNGTGFNLTSVGSGESQAYAVTVQPNGKVDIAGVASTSGGNDEFGVVRVNTDGTIDTSFGTSGQSVTTFGTNDDADATSVAFDNQKIIVAGSADIGTTGDDDFAVERYVANNAPVATGNATLATIDENQSNSPGDTVAAIVSRMGITDADGDSVGIAITGIDDTHGTWQYSTDSGSTWTAIPVTTSTTSALLLASSTSNVVRFVPNVGFTGNAALTVRPWDLTQGTSASTYDTTGSDANNLNAFGASGTATETVSPASSSVYVNSTWAGSTQGQSVTDSLGQTHTFGIDAFSTVTDGVTLVAPGGTVYVDGGAVGSPLTYSEDVTINQTETLSGYGAVNPTLTAPSTASNGIIVSVQAPNVTVEKLNIIVDQPNAAAGIAAIDPAGANPSVFDGLKVLDNTITSTGSGGAIQLDPSYGTPSKYSAGIAVIAEAAGTAPTVDIEGNSVDVSTTPSFSTVGRGIWANQVQGHFDNNTVEAVSYEDMQLSFLRGPTTVDGNTLTGTGLTITEPNAGATVDVSGNTFAPAFGVDDGMVEVRHDYNASAPVSIHDNTFTLLSNTIGVLSAESIGVSVDHNTFTPAAGAMNTTAVYVDTQTPSSSEPAPAVSDSISITNNSFDSAAGQNATAVYVADHDSGTNGPGNDFGAVTVTGNTFSQNLAQFIDLAPSAATASYSGDSVTAIHPASVNLNVDATSNTFGVSSGDTTLTNADYYEIEDKIVDGVDYTGGGLVRIEAGNVFVTPNSFNSAGGTTTPSIQRGVDAASSGDTVNVEAGSYSISGLNLNKAITLSGAFAGTPGTDNSRGTGETILNGPANQSQGAFTLSTTAPVTITGFEFDGSHIFSNEPGASDIHIIDNVLNLQAMAGAGETNMIFSDPKTIQLKDNDFTTSGENPSNSAIMQVAGDYAGNLDTTNVMDVTGNTFNGIANPSDGQSTLQLNFDGVQGNVQGNTFNGVDIGILIAGHSGNLTATENTFENITRGSTEIATGSFGAGIAIYNPIFDRGTVTISNNVFEDSDTGIRTSTDGSGTFTLNSPALTVSGNEFTGNIYNIVDKFAGEVDLAGDNVLDGTTLSSATLPQLYAIEDKIIDGIDAAGFGLVRLRAGNVYVTPNSFFAPASNDAGAVQRAVNIASSGDTVNLEAGTYVENTGHVDSAAGVVAALYIGKPLTLLGPQATFNGQTDPTPATADQAIIEPGTSNPNPNSSTAEGVIYVGSGNVTIQGVTIDGRNEASGFSHADSSATVDGNAVDASAGIESFVDVGDINISNNIVENTGYVGVDFENSVNATTGNTISSNLIEHLSSHYGFGIGVVLYNNFYADVTNNKITDAYVGVQTGNFYLANPGAAVGISGNDITAGKAGIFFNLAYESASTFAVSNNTITAATDPNASRWIGVLVASIQNGDATFTNNTIDGSGFTDTSKVTAGYEFWNDPTTGSVAVTGGSVTGVDYGVWANSFEGYNSNGGAVNASVNNLSVTASVAGVYVEDSSQNTNHPNVSLTVTGSTITAPTGVLISGSHASANVASSTIDPSVGIDVEGGTLTIGAGDIITAADTGLLLNGASAAVAGDTLNDLTFTGQTGNYITLSGGAEAGKEIDATAATFDGVLGSSVTLSQAYAIEDKITDAIDEDGVGFVRIKAGNVYVTPNSFVLPATEDTGAISRAVGAATAGDTVNLEAGVYYDEVTIDKSLTLKGPNSGMNPNTAMRTNEAIIEPSVAAPDPNSANSSPIIYITANNVTIDGVTVDGANPNLTGGVSQNGKSVDAIEGISSYEGISNLISENNILQDLSYAGMDLYNYYNNGAATGGNVISDNEFSNIGDPTYGFGIGILLYNNFYANVTGNVMTGVQVGVQTGNFSQANPGGAVGITNNTITASDVGIFFNLMYGGTSNIPVTDNTINAASDPTNGDPWTGVLITSIQSGVNVELTDNTINGSGASDASGKSAGVEFWNDPTTGSVSVTGGSITGVDYGVWANSYEGYSSNGSSINASVDNVSITANVAGVYVEDSSQNTNHPTVAVAVTDSTISAPTGILISGSHASADVTGTTIDPVTGIDVENGTLTIGSGDQITNSTTGLLLNGTSAAVTGNTLNDLAFSGVTGQDIVLSGGAENGQEINGTGASFDGVVGSAATTAQAYAIEDKITDAIDETGVGFVRIKSGNVYVTPNSFSVAHGTTSPSIQRAINAASPGDTIHVESGTYTENVNVNKSVTIEGDGTPVVTAASGNVMTISASNVTLDGLAVTGGARGIDLTGTISGDTLENLSVTGQSNFAIEVDNSGVISNLDVDTVTASANSTSGVGFNVATTGQVNGLTITNSDFDNNAYGLETQIASNSTGNSNAFTDVNVSNTTFNNDVQRAIYVEKLNQATFDNITVNNSGSAAGANAVDINLKGGTYGSLTIENSTFTNDGTPTSPTSYDHFALSIKGRNDGSYAGNPGSLSGVTLTNNSISSTGVDLDFENNVTGVILSGNQLNGTGAGLTDAITAAGTLSTGDTTFAGTLSRYIGVNSANNVDATGATFDAVAPTDNTASDLYGVEDKIADYLDNAVVGYVTLRDGQVYVAQSSETPNADAIQRGVNAAQGGDVVNVQAGTYAGPVAIINKNITLEGAGQASTTIVATSNIPATSDNKNAVIYVNGGTDTIENLTVDGANEGSNYANGFVGIDFSNGGGTVDNVTVKNVENSSFNGVQNGVAIYAKNTDSVSRTLNINHDTINTYQKGGIVALGSGLTVHIDNNTVTGNGDTPVIAQNGIEVGSGATGSITNNDVSGNEYSGTNPAQPGGADQFNDVQSTGLLLFGTSGLTVSGNTIDGNDIGIYNNTDSAVISNNQLGNTTANRYEGILEDQGSASITGNTITGGNLGIDVVTFDGESGEASSAVIDGNTVTGANIGIEAIKQSAGDPAVDVLAQNNTLTGNTEGVLVSGGATVDLGDINNTNSTGLGSSVGNNTLTGYTGVGGNYAIDDENTSSQPGVLAQNNDFGKVSANNTAVIGTVIKDHTDNASLSSVNFTPPEDVAAAPNVVYVNSTWATAGFGNDPDGAGPATSFGYDAFTTIQDAINAVATGGTVYVEGGTIASPLTYAEDVVISRSMTLSGYGAVNPTLTAPSTASNGIIVSVQAPNVTVEKLNIIVDQPNAAAGIAAIDPAGANPSVFDGLKVLDNTITSTGSGGAIQLDPSYGTPSKYSAGIAVIAEAAGTAPTVDIEGNSVDVSTTPSFSTVGRGIWANQVQGHFDNNTVEAVSYEDMQLSFLRGPTTVDGNTLTGTGLTITEPNAGATVDVSGNTFAPAFGVDDGMVEVRHDYNASAPVSIHDNTFTLLSNTIGVLSAESIGVSVDHNTFTPAAGAMNTTAVYVDTQTPSSSEPAPAVSDSISITNNSFDSAAGQNATAVYVADHDSGTNGPGNDFGAVTVTGNTFSQNLAQFIDLAPSAATASYSGDSVTAIHPASVNLNVDATSNTFGVSSGDTTLTNADYYEIEDKIVDGVDYTGGGLVRIEAGNVFVTPNSFNSAGGTTTPSIQRGVDVASDGDIVNVQGGTYTRHVSGADTVLDIDKPVSVIATDGPAATTIDGASAADNYYVVKITSSNAMLSGFTITNAQFNGTADASGVVVESLVANSPLTDVTVSGNVIHDIGSVTRAHADGTFGINVEGEESGSGVTNSHFDDNTIYNIGNADAGSFAAGILTAGDVGEEVNGVTMNGNTVYNISHPELAVGIDAGYGSENVTIEGNTIGINNSDPMHPVAGAVGEGIHTSSGEFGPVSITANIISNASVAGLHLLSPYSDTVYRNTISSSTVGLDVAPGAVLTSATENYFTGNGTGILIESGAGSVGPININSISGNTTAGLENDSTVTVDASQNWWGSADGPNTPLNTFMNPTTGDTIIGPATISPWLADGIDSDTNAPGFQHAAASDTAPPKPDAPSLADATNSGSKADDITNFKRPEIVGTAQPGSTVTLLDGSTVIGTGTADATTGQYDITSTVNLADGIHTFTVYATDSSGNQSPPSDSLTVDIDTQAPSPSITDVSTAHQEGTDVVLNGGFTDPSPSFGSPTFLWHVSASNGQVIADATTQDFTFTPNDNGTYTVTYTVTDAAGNAASTTDVIAIGNVAPSNLNVSTTPSTINENDTTTLNGSFVDPGTQDPHTVTVDWGDGTAMNPDVQTYSLAAGVTTFSETHQYLNNNPSNALFTISVTVADNSNDSTSSSTTVTVDNVAPSALSVSAAPPTINENGSTSLSGSFTDPGTLDTHSVTIDWGDGTAQNPDTQTFALGAGVTSFSGVTHQYLNNNPANAPYTVNVTVTDSDGASTSSSTNVEVDNVAPSALNLTATPPTINENGTTSLSGTFTDPGTQDTHTVVIDWGDGTAQNPDTQTVTLGAGVTSFSGVTHQYLNNNAGDAPYTVNVTVTDIDGTSTTGSTSVNVYNVAPSALNLTATPPTIDENGTTSLSGSFTDPGTLDTHSVYINWGDGSDTTVLNLAAGVTSFSGVAHQYLNNQPGDAAYTVSVTVIDASNAATSATTGVTVQNVAPASLSLTATPPTINENGTTSLSGTFTDPGTQDTHTVVIDWGDGTTQNPDTQTVTLGADVTSFSGVTHQYLNNNPGNAPYTVSVTVTDNDGASTTGSTSVTVDNVAPSALSVTATPPTINENQTTSLSGSFTEPGTLDTHSVTIDWGDGTAQTPDTQTFTLGAGVTSFSGVTHQYLNNNPNNAPYTVNVTVTDSDGASTTGSTSVTVNDVAPTVTLTGSKSDNSNPTTNDAEGSAFTLTLSPVTDPGYAGGDRVQSYFILWGDGTTQTVPVSSINQTTGGTITHVYQDGTVPQGSTSATDTIQVDIIDNDGYHADTGSLDIVVYNVAPTASFGGSNSVPEGSGANVAFFSQTDPSPVDQSAGFTYSYDFNNDGIFEVTNSSSSSMTVPASILSTPGTYTIRGRITDKDGGFTDYTHQITVTNVAPSINNIPDATANQNATFTQAGSFADPGNDSPWQVYANYNYSAMNNGQGTLVQTSASKSFTLSHVYDTPGNYVVQVTVIDSAGAIGQRTFNVTVNATNFQVTTFTPEADGFEAAFNRAANTGVLNLYSGVSNTLGASDVTVVGNSTGAVNGSLVWNPTTNTVDFVATSGVLKPDTYTVTLVSGANAWVDTNGNTLNGGPNYTTTFTVSSTADVVTIPSFARGPGQDVNLPASSNVGIPITISDGTGVTAVDFDLFYNPALLSITSVNLAGDLPGGWSVATNASTPGEIQISASGITTLSSGMQTVLDIVASVPTGATYGADAELKITNLRVNENQIASVGKNSIEAVAYLGDATGNKGYSTTDASRISNVVVHNNSGFDAYPVIDPIIIGDVTGDGTLSGQDASLVAQESVGIPVSQLPAIPAGGNVAQLSQMSGRSVSIPSNVLAYRSGMVSVPINIDDDTGIQGANFQVTFDSTQLSLAATAATNGSLDPSGDWTVVYYSPSPGVVNVGIYSPTGQTLAGGSGSLINVNFNVASNATLAATPVTIAPQDGGLNEGDIAMTTTNGSVLVDLIPSVTNVVLSGSAWKPAFLTYLQGLNANNVGGYSIPTGSGQLSTLPWTNLNQVSITFNQDVSVTEDALQIVGVNTASYSFAAVNGFSYNSTTYTATWTLSGPIGDDKLLIDLDNTKVVNANGSHLSGSWTDGSSSYPSGNGETSSAFIYRFNVLPGDINQNGTENAGDTGFTQAHQASSTTINTASYSIFADVNGDGTINAADTAQVQARQATTLPAGNPTPPAGGNVATASVAATPAAIPATTSTSTTTPAAVSAAPAPVIVTTTPLIAVVTTSASPAATPTIATATLPTPSIVTAPTVTAPVVAVAKPVVITAAPVITTTPIVAKAAVALTTTKSTPPTVTASTTKKPAKPAPKTAIFSVLPLVQGNLPGMLAPTSSADADKKKGKVF